MVQPIASTISASRAYRIGNKAFYALNEVSMKAYAGELLIIRGRSGSGKTTLLNLLAGLDLPTGGSVFFKGESLSDMGAEQRDKLRRNEIGMVFQSLALFPFLTARENVEAALRLETHHKNRLGNESEKWLSYVGLGDRMKHLPDELSGGEKQRVAIARAVSRNPSLLLADEPTAMLDTKTSLQMMELFVRLSVEKGICVVITTHNPLVLPFASRVCTLENGRIASDD
ncbi:MAG: ABC transporter ATP-binding protein [Christensenellales bacterium]|jgi:putative ABC transport system ATP-binding protein